MYSYFVLLRGVPVFALFTITVEFSSLIDFFALFTIKVEFSSLIDARIVQMFSYPFFFSLTDAHIVQMFVFIFCFFPLITHLH